MAAEPVLLGFLGGLLGGAPSAVLTEIALHRVRHRLDRGQEKTDALANLEMAIGHVEDEWQTYDEGLGLNDERARRLEELRAVLNVSRISLGKPLHASLTASYKQMAAAAQAGRPDDVRRGAKQALEILDVVGHRGRWLRRGP